MLTSSFPRIPCFSEVSLLVLVKVRSHFMEHQSGKEMSRLCSLKSFLWWTISVLSSSTPSLLFTFPFLGCLLGPLYPFHRCSAKREINKSILLCFSQRGISVGRNLICLLEYLGLCPCVCVCVCVCVCARAKSLQSRLTLCDPMDYSRTGSFVCGIFQAGTL